MEKYEKGPKIELEIKRDAHHSTYMNCSPCKCDPLHTLVPNNVNGCFGMYGAFVL